MSPGDGRPEVRNLEEPKGWGDRQVSRGAVQRLRSGRGWRLWDLGEKGVREGSGV